jgi:hypothetical protein
VSLPLKAPALALIRLRPAVGESPKAQQD